MVFILRFTPIKMHLRKLKINVISLSLYLCYSPQETRLKVGEASIQTAAKVPIKEAQKNHEQMQESRRVWATQYQDGSLQLAEPQIQCSCEWSQRGQTTQSRLIPLQKVREIKSVQNISIQLVRLYYLYYLQLESMSFPFGVLTAFLLASPQQSSSKSIWC